MLAVMVGAFWWVLVFRCLFCVCFLLDSLRLTSSLVVPFLGDCDNPVARACRGKKSFLSDSVTPFFLAFLLFFLESGHWRL